MQIKNLPKIFSSSWRIPAITLLIFSWVFSSWPQIYNFPPGIQKAYAATNTVTFTTTGTTAWVAPAGVTFVSAECWGTGGSSGGSSSTTKGGSGGGGGAYAKTASVAVTPGSSYNIVVGAVGSTGTGAGGVGGDTSFVGNSSQSCLAKGGGGGAANGGTAGTGGLASASTGDPATKFNGGSGFTTTGTSGGGGGGSGGTAAGGNSATSVTAATAVTGGGPGGTGGGPHTNGNSPASGPGGGAGGAGCEGNTSCSTSGSHTKTGATGFLGQVKLTYTLYTVLGDTTDPSNASLTAGDPATMADAFTLQTSLSTDVVTAVVVGLGTGASSGISLVEITDSAGTTVYGSVDPAGNDNPSITLNTNTLTANTTLTTYKIRITPKTTVTGGPYTVNAKINSYTSTNSQTSSDIAGTTITISAPTVISITITSSGTISYGTLAAGVSSSTVSAYTQTAKNDGTGSEAFNIKGQNTACPWTLSGTSGTDQYIHEFSINGGSSWTALTTTYQTLATGIAANGTQNFDLRLTVPSSTACFTQQSADVTIQAVAG